MGLESGIAEPRKEQMVAEKQANSAYRKRVGNAVTASRKEYTKREKVGKMPPPPPLPPLWRFNDVYAGESVAAFVAASKNGEKMPPLARHAVKIVVISCTVPDC
jgi:hypothetical protein